LHSNHALLVHAADGFAVARPPARPTARVGTTAASAAKAPSPDGLSGRRRTILGTPDAVRAGIEAAAAEYGAEEVIVVTITYDHAARRRSYELIAEAFGLAAAPSLAA
jgi:alkanesulfonate monooxygenase SsuD/methylene tetrahydromethanopterin reductase-like flavin-dependent oxidoreductase (luciferase family)